MVAGIAGNSSLATATRSSNGRSSQKKSRTRSAPTLRCRGCDLFRVVCDRDLEGIVAKWDRGTYRTDGRATSWVKIKNPYYTQMRDPRELFASRGSEGTRRGRAPMRPDLVLR